MRILGRRTGLIAAAAALFLALPPGPRANAGGAGPGNNLKLKGGLQLHVSSETSRAPRPSSMA
jgi:hypothetical protein